jgi:NAD(P)-dependent dehydrogenase (short-subunit alcohol dehydrogenase family)
MASPGRLTGKVAVVTGAGSGIGRAIAIQFAAAGARVALWSRGTDSGIEAETAAKSAADHGGEAYFAQIDVTIPEQVDAGIEELLDRWGKLDVLVCAAGISGRKLGDAPTAECTLDGWNTVIQANLTSVFLCCRAALPPMIGGGGGAIVTISSVLGIVGGDEHFSTHAYAASKGGVIALTRAIATTYARNRVRANTIAPGLIRTKMTQRAQDNPEIMASLTWRQPLTGAIGAPDDVAAAALYLATDEAAFVTGVVLPVDAGWLAH